ncbi:MAG: hypothetical protein ABS46_18395 [Cytophagaceae bacterium SCN 52-12]|nr:MAG: hypothetical protein ABS46_18395 [Cytophagaceae bacterium SCN 52-12]
MRSSAFLLIMTGVLMLSSCQQPSQTQADTSNYKNEVEEAVESLRKQLLDPEKEALQNLTSEKLTYGHSAGLIENQAEFIESLISGKFNFETLDLTGQTIDISGETAIVRHNLTGNTADAGKEPGTANLKVLQVWQKQDSGWKLLARQAVKNVVQ